MNMWPTKKFAKLRDSKRSQNNTSEILNKSQHNNFYSKLNLSMETTLSDPKISNSKQKSQDSDSQITI